MKVRLPWTPDNGGAGYEVWARLATLMAGAKRGTWFIPDPGDEVLVVFEGGDPRRPYVVGALWNGARRAARERWTATGNNYKKSIVLAQRHPHHAGRHRGPGDADPRDAGRPEA